MSRYYEPLAQQEVFETINEIIDKYFPHLANVQIKVLMDSKKRKSKGQYTFASIKKMSDKEKFLSANDDAPEGYDYLMILDGNLFDNISKEDKVKLIRHELRHIHIDNEAKDPLKIQDHDVRDFREELKLNSDDPDWDLRLAEICESIYES